MNKRMGIVFLCAFLLSSQMLVSQETTTKMGDADKKECHFKTKKDDVNKYRKYLENTTWVVPPSTLLAYDYENGTAVPVSDQTVWVINKFDGGYFFGDCYTSINRVPSTHKKLVGSITSFGDVYITFYSISGNLTKTDVVDGIGNFRKIDGEYVFVMQMNSAQNNLFGLSHWSYMISVTKNDPFYKHLPGENMSVPEFISQF